MKYLKYAKSIKADLKAFLTHNKKEKKGGMCSAHNFTMKTHTVYESLQKSLNP